MPEWRVAFLCIRYRGKSLHATFASHKIWWLTVRFVGKVVHNNTDYMACLNFAGHAFGRQVQIIFCIVSIRQCPHLCNILTCLFNVLAFFRDVMSTFMFLMNKVRPIRNNQNKKALSSGRGFCSAVALSIASAARKRGWKGTGAAGGAVAIAEATADMLRSRSSEAGGGALVSAITVAPNGFINFEAGFGPSSTLVSTHGQLVCGVVVSALVSGADVMQVFRGS